MTYVVVVLVLWSVLSAVYNARKHARMERLLEQHVEKRSNLLMNMQDRLDGLDAPVKLLTDLENFDQQLSDETRDIFEGMHTPGFQERLMVLQEQRLLEQEKRRIEELKRESEEAARAAEKERRQAEKLEAQQAERDEKAQAKAAEVEAERLRAEEEERKEIEHQERWSARWKELKFMAPEDYDDEFKHMLADRLTHATGLEDLSWTELKSSDSHYKFGAFRAEVPDFIDRKTVYVGISESHKAITLFLKGPRGTMEKLRSWSWKHETPQDDDDMNPGQLELFSDEEPQEDRLPFHTKVERLLIMAKDSVYGFGPRQLTSFERASEARMKFRPTYKRPKS